MSLGRKIDVQSSSDPIGARLLSHIDILGPFDLGSIMVLVGSFGPSAFLTQIIRFGIKFSEQAVQTAMQEISTPRGTSSHLILHHRVRLLCSHSPRSNLSPDSSPLTNQRKGRLLCYRESQKEGEFFFENLIIVFYSLAPESTDHPY